MIKLAALAAGRDSEFFERRTSNAQRRTSNIDDATLYLFKINEPQNFEN